MRRLVSLVLLSFGASSLIGGGGLVWAGAATGAGAATEAGAPARTQADLAPSTAPNARGEYSLALRGNGHRMGAHWGAMASLVEQHGFPLAMAGGSSASLSMFLLESVALNPLVQGQSTSRQKALGSLLLKSVHGFLRLSFADSRLANVTGLTQYLHLAQEGPALIPKELLPDWTQLWRLSEYEEEAHPDLWIERYQFFLFNKKQLLQAWETAVNQGWLNREVIKRGQHLIRLITLSSDAVEVMESIREFRFLVEELERGIAQVGRFDAAGDANLFVRPGILDFQGLATSFGQMADFYAGYFMQEEELALLKQFVARCEQASLGRTWAQLISVRPDCQEKLGQLLKSYFAHYLERRTQAQAPLSRVQEPVGRYISAFPTTAVLVGEGAKRVSGWLKGYQETLSADYGRDFKVEPWDLRFGYWGKEEDLDLLLRHLQQDPLLIGGQDMSRDRKTEKFFALGEASWLEVLSYSPAEPGLAPLLPLRLASGEKVYSAGGWSDLSPTIVLQAHLESSGKWSAAASASGFQPQRIYLTRRGEESQFAQDVLARLVGPDSLEGHRLFSAENPHSSFVQSHRQAFVDQIMLTDWNDLDPLRDGLTALIEEGYRAPLLSPVMACGDLLEKGP